MSLSLCSSFLKNLKCHNIKFKNQIMGWAESRPMASFATLVADSPKLSPLDLIRELFMLNLAFFYYFFYLNLSKRI